MKKLQHMTEAKAALMMAAGCIRAVASAVYGGWNSAMSTLTIFMMIDYVMGLIVAGVFHNSDKSKGGSLDSHEGWKGLWRKGVTLLVVLVAARLDVTMGTTFIKDAVVLAYIANEAISIMENAGLMGVPYPEPMRKALAQLQGKNQEGEK